LRNPPRHVYPDNILNEKQENKDSAQPNVWSERYTRGKTPWQLDRVPTRLNVFIQSLSPSCNILIPGSGQDYRTIDAFRKAGHRVTAIDFSPVAVESTNKALKEAGDKIIQGDFFTHDFEAAPFDLIYERTFLCSLPPSVWENYAARIANLLRPSGVLVGFFFYGQQSEPPPHPLTERKADEIFGERFELEKSESVTDSLPIFAGQEKWQEWRLRS